MIFYVGFFSPRCIPLLCEKCVIVSRVFCQLLVPRFSVVQLHLLLFALFAEEPCGAGCCLHCEVAPLEHAKRPEEAVHARGAMPTHVPARLPFEHVARSAARCIFCW